MKRVALFIVLTLAFAGWVTPLNAHEQLTTDTQVIGIWRDADGREVGRYRTTLGDLNDVGMQVTDQESRIADLEMLISKMVTDPEMRGHLLRHDMTAEELDRIAAHFGGTK